MKYLRIYSVPAVALTLLFAGCTKWLDVKPKTQIEQSQLFTGEQGFEDAMYGAYTTMAGPSLYGDQLTMSFIDVLAQRYNCQSNPSHAFYQASVYRYQDAGVKGRIANIWDSMYNAIANVNNVLANIDTKSGVFQSDNYQLVKGEALGMRAFMHFDLLRMFGPSYVSNPAKACIPYVTTVSGGVTPLSTVSTVLDSVITDLTAAESLLSGYKTVVSDFALNGSTSLENDWLNKRQFHFNYWAAEATLARVCLYKGDKQDALRHALNVIQSGMFQFVTADRINIFKDRTFATEQIFSLSKFNLLTQVNTYFQSTGAGGGNLGANNQLTNSYGNGGVVDQVFEITSGGATDFRYTYLWQLSNVLYFPSKFWQDGSNANLDNLIPIIRLPEMYYIAAESSDPVAATGYLNTVRENRGLKDLPSGMDAATLQNEIFKEYEKEFYCEGQLFYYYKRLNLPQILYTSIPASDNIYVFPLPDAETQFGQR